VGNNEIQFTLADDEGVSDVSRVVDAEADGENDVDAGEGVDGDGPEVKEANNVNQGQENANLDQKTFYKLCLNVLLWRISNKVSQNKKQSKHSIIAYSFSEFFFQKSTVT
jgi:hypothetical protein